MLKHGHQTITRPLMKHRTPNFELRTLNCGRGLSVRRINRCSAFNVDCSEFWSLNRKAAEGCRTPRRCRELTRSPQFRELILPSSILHPQFSILASSRGVSLNVAWGSSVRCPRFSVCSGIQKDMLKHGHQKAPSRSQGSVKPRRESQGLVKPCKNYATCFQSTLNTQPSTILVKPSRAIIWTARKGQSCRSNSILDERFFEVTDSLLAGLASRVEDRLNPESAIAA
jgi:hypothetical protein